MSDMDAMNEDSRRLRPLTPSAEWSRHFLNSAALQREIPWDLGAADSQEELAAIAGSLAAWHAVMTTDGIRFYHAAVNYAAKTRDPDHIAATRWYVAEQRRHAAMLGRFLDTAGLKRARPAWHQRLLRSFSPGMELLTTFDVLRKVHSRAYLGAIRRATSSCVLRAICEQIVADEVAHIRFHCERLAAMHRRRPAPLRCLTRALHSLALAAMTIAAWARHRRALRAGECGLGKFWQLSRAKMRQASRAMSPEWRTWTLEPAPIKSLAAPRIKHNDRAEGVSPPIPNATASS